MGLRFWTAIFQGKIQKVGSLVIKVRANTGDANLSAQASFAIRKQIGHI